MSGNVERPALEREKFRDPRWTTSGAARAWVEVDGLEILWFNTGTLCNIECCRCYVESSPSNDRLSYLSADEVVRYLDEAGELDPGLRGVGFTGGEPFMNPEILSILEESLDRDLDVLILTNAMQPMMRPGMQAGLMSLRKRHGARLHLRVSLDHHTAQLHETERGPGSWASALRGLRWLRDRGFRPSIAGRTCWGESEAEARRGYAALFAAEDLELDPDDPSQLVLFPEMDVAVDVPEITVDCWSILGVDPSAMMCARSRMVVKRRGSQTPVVMSCTLIPYDRRFELGSTLAEALTPVPLNHPHCARFCVLGGVSCDRG